MRTQLDLTTFVYAIPDTGDAVLGLNTDISPNICPAPKSPTVDDHISLVLSKALALFLLSLSLEGEQDRKMSLRSFACLLCLVISLGSVDDSEGEGVPWWCQEEEEDAEGDDARVELTVLFTSELLQ